MTATLDEATLEEARDWLRDRVEDGERCPCCTQFAKVYKRKIHATMARELIRCVRAHQVGEWFYLPDLIERGGDIGKVRYWELLEEDEAAEREDGSSRAGWWRVTLLGAAFVHAQVRVPKYARIYDGRCLGLTGDPISIRDALGDKFDYEELMSA